MQAFIQGTDRFVFRQHTVLVWVGAPFQQQPDDLFVPGLDREGKETPAGIPLPVDLVRVHALVQQAPDDVDIPFFDGLNHSDHMLFPLC